MKPHILLAATVLLAALAAAQQATDTSAERMGKRLHEIYAHNDFRSDPNKPAERDGYYKQLLTQSLPIGDRTTVAMELANEQLRAGDSRLRQRRLARPLCRP